VLVVNMAVAGAGLLLGSRPTREILIGYCRTIGGLF
jgi:hypothetical protein